MKSRPKSSIVYSGGPQTQLKGNRVIKNPVLGLQIENTAHDAWIQKQQDKLNTIDFQWASRHYRNATVINQYSFLKGITPKNIKKQANRELFYRRESNKSEKPNIINIIEQTQTYDDSVFDIDISEALKPKRKPLQNFSKRKTSFNFDYSPKTTKQNAEINMGTLQSTRADDLNSILNNIEKHMEFTKELIQKVNKKEEVTKKSHISSPTLSEDAQIYNNIKKQSKQGITQTYYRKNDLFIEADKKIKSKILKPLFMPIENIQFNEDESQIDTKMYANIENLNKLTGTKLVYKIYRESNFVQDPINPRFEIIENWYKKQIEQRSTIIEFIRHSNPVFHEESAFRLNDIAQRLKAKKYEQGTVLKQFGYEPVDVYFICSGSIQVNQRKYTEKDGEEIETIVPLNIYQCGRSLGDPELNFNTPMHTQVVVNSNDTKVVKLSRETFYYVYNSKLNSIIQERKRLLVENFVAFTAWNDQKLWIVCELMKTRVMQKNEVLFEDSTRAEMLYFLVKGELRIEKEVDIKKEMFYPIEKQKWLANQTNQKVLFTIKEIKPFQLVGEQQMLYNQTYPVRVVSSVKGTVVITITKRDFEKQFTSNKDKFNLLDILSTVIFPTHDEVIRDIEIFKKVHKIKKNAFMNSCDQNRVFGPMDNKSKWVESNQKNIKDKINKRIKVIKQRVENPNYDPDLYNACRNTLSQEYDSDSDIRDLQIPKKQLSIIERQYLKKLSQRINTREKLVSKQVYSEEIGAIDYAKRKMLKEITDTSMAEQLLQVLADEANGDFILNKGK